MRVVNLAIKFALELAALAAFAYWGTTLPGTAASAITSISAPLAMIGLWGIFAAPRSRRRLPAGSRIPFELTVFALATGALLGSGEAMLAAAFATTAVLNTILLTRFDQRERRGGGTTANARGFAPNIDPGIAPLKGDFCEDNGC